MPLPEPLVFPSAVRLATPDEIPGPLDPDIQNRLAAARITTGYYLKSTDKSRSSHFAELNVHASDVWPTFRDLVLGLLPAKAALLIGTDDDEPHKCHYTERDALLTALERVATPLASDCYIEFGAIWQTSEETEEVFVRNVKYFQVWTSKPDTFRQIMTARGIPEVPALEFIDEYPRTTHALHHEGIGDFAALVDCVLATCKSLPAA